MKSDRFYRPDEIDRLFVEMDDASREYIGNNIFRRAISLAHDRRQYYDSLFIHVGAALLIADPPVSCRLSNQNAYSPQRIEMMFSKWPAVVESLALSERYKEEGQQCCAMAQPSMVTVHARLGVVTP